MDFIKTALTGKDNKSGDIGRVALVLGCLAYLCFEGRGAFGGASIGRGEHDLHQSHVSNGGSHQKGCGAPYRNRPQRQKNFRNNYF